MAPTICSEKKRQTRTIATTNIRRHGQGTQLNPALSNIVNFVARGPLNPKAPASLRIQTHKKSARNSDTTVSNYNHLTHTSATSVSNHHRQELSVTSDNAVTFSAHSDMENSLDLRLAREILSIGLTATYDSNSANTSKESSRLASSISETSSLSSYKAITSSPTLKYQERLYKRYATAMQTNEGNDDSGSEETDLCDENENNNKLNLNKKLSALQTSSKRKYYFSCNDFDSDDDDLGSTGELSSDMSSAGSDTDMEADESDSMTSLDTEKSAKLKRSNPHNLLKDKLIVKQLNSNNNSSNTCNTDGLLSIAIKTIKLVKRNQLLQQRLTQLQLETSDFIQSVMANPENRHFRENIEQKV